MAENIVRESRKVQITGKSSCMVSLPMRWVKEMGLVQGSTVKITSQTSHSLLITPGELKNDAKHSGTANLLIKSESPETTLRRIKCLYGQGYSTILVKFANANPLNPLNAIAIREMVRDQFIGVELVADSPDLLTLQVLLGKSELSTQNSIKQMSFVASCMQRDAIRGLTTFDKRLVHEVIANSEVERFNNYLDRHLNSVSSSDSSTSDEESYDGNSLALHRMLAKSICSAAASAKSIAEYTLTMNCRLEDGMSCSVSRMGNLACELFDGALLAYFKKELSAAEKNIEATKEFALYERELLQSVGRSVARPCVASLSVGSLKQIVAESVAISELVIRLTIDQVESPKMRVMMKDEMLLIRPNMS